MTVTIRIDAWAEYLSAFDEVLAAKRDPAARLLARRRMVAILEADPEYWRVLVVERARLADANVRRLELNGEQAAGAARARWDQERAA